MTTTPRRLAVVATYNERDNIESLLSMLLALPHTLEVVVVDDNSPDGTGDAIDAVCLRDSRVHVIHRSGKLGLGTALLAGMRFGLTEGFSQIITMDADFSHHPRFVPSLVEPREKADVVIGSRYVRGGGVLGCSLHRRALSWGANLFAGVALGLGARDCTAGFRCYSRECLERVNLASIVADGYSFLIELLFYLRRSGATVAEVPIVFEDRRFGTSKISKAEIRKAVRTVLRLSRLRLGGRGVASGVNNAAS